MVPAILAMRAGEFKQRFVLVSNCGSLGIHKNTQLLGCCLLEDTKAETTLEIPVYRKKPLGPMS